MAGRDVLDTVRAADGVVGFLGAVAMEAALQGVESKVSATTERTYKCVVLSIFNMHLIWEIFLGIVTWRYYLGISKEALIV